MVVKLIDVARHAGVAPSTVSHVLSGNRPISAATRQRVEDSIATLGFHPHAGARSIRRQRTDVIALVLPIRRSSPSWLQMRFVLAALDAARERDLNLMLLTAEDGVASIRKVVDRAMVDGVIVMEVELGDPRVATLEQMARPAVLIGTPADETSLVGVDFDFRTAGALCVQHLHALGHDDVAYLGHPRSTYDRGIGYAIRARDGALAAMGTAGRPELWAPTELTDDGAATAIDWLLSRQPVPTGLVIYNELAGPTLLRRLAETAPPRRRPFSVVTIGQDDQADHPGPMTTNVAIPAAALGRLAVEELAALIAGSDDVAQCVLLPPTVQDNGSTRPARPARRTRAPRGATAD